MCPQFYCYAGHMKLGPAFSRNLGGPSEMFAFTSVMFFLTACTSQNEAMVTDLAAVNKLPIRNLSNPEQTIFSAGQPTMGEFEALAQAGIEHIVNLRPKSEQDWDEAGFVNSLGMQYHLVPVAGIAGVTLDNAASLAAVLEAIEGEATIVHCGSGNRVGALIALREGLLNGQSVDDSIATGKLWGLTRLEPLVRTKLAAPK